MKTETLTTTADLSLRKEFIMTEEDINFLNSLPDNLPESHLTTKQKSTVNELYYKYISKNNVVQGWGTELYTLEQKENWPSGEKIKRHEAQRFILGWLEAYNSYYSNMEGNKALEFVFRALTHREADQILINKCYELK